ncbi:MAG: FkbM family methyltransferase [Microscillaceae bacterium]|nr:FkbM family methyltransferase [Microscillaceae bacterium]
MNILNRLFKSRGKEYPQVVKIHDLPNIPTIQFKVYNQIEVQRTRNFGGERPALEYFLSILHQQDIVYDVGASVGLFSITASQRVSNGKIFAFEPDFDTFARLNENILFNGINNIQTIQLALTDREGTLDLYTDGTEGFAPTLAFQKDRIGAPKNKISIKGTTIDNLIQSGEVMVPDVIKIDIEGAESLCLSGAKGLLRGDFEKKTRDLFIEFHPDFLPDFGSSVEKLHDLISSFEYEVIWSEGRDKQEHFHYRLMHL